MSTINIVLVGGGSGGHFYPLIAIAESLNSTPEQPNLYYMGPDPYDAAMLTQNNIHFVSIPAGKRRKYFSLLNYTDFFKTIYGVFVAFVKMYHIYPDVIVSKGGFTSVPVVFSAVFFRIPVIVHESDAKMGTANKLFLRFARHVVVSYDELAQTLTHKSIHTLGIPVRKALLKPPTTEAISSLGIDATRPLIFVIGGSQGAERINQYILDSLDELLTTYSIIHQTGTDHFEITKLSADRLIPNPEMRAHYHPFPFLNEVQMNDAYHLAQIVVSRAGSTSLYEIALHGKPSIVIPVPEEVSHDQRSNAYAYARTGAGTVIEEKNLSDSLLRSEIDRIMQEPDVYDTMSRAATLFGKTTVADEISQITLDIAREHQ